MKNFGNTIKLFDIDAYQREFHSVVCDCQKKGEQYEILLESTLFFPEEGGQEHDTGTIEVDGTEYAVLDVQIRDGIIYHTTKEPIEPGKEVQGKINFARRYDFMQNHSGEHILTGCIHNHFGYQNVGFHLNETLMTMDFNGTLSIEQMEQVEKEANQIILENVPITAVYPEKEELEKLNYRSKKEIDGALRLVQIGAYDLCACCAPHVKSTAEVGLIKIVKAENWKGGMRLTTLCGSRAYQDYAKKHEIMSQLAKEYSTSYEKLPGILVAKKEEAIQKDAMLLALQTESLKTTLKKEHLVFQSEGNGQAIRKAVDDVMHETTKECIAASQSEPAKECGNILGVFTGSDEAGYRYLLGSTKIDMTEIGKKLQEGFGAKGGGSKEMLQGMVNATKEQLIALLDD